MQRRQFLHSVAVAAAGACPVCLAVARARASGGQRQPHWGYEGETGPEHWGGLSPDFRACDIGLQQSPIDLAGAIEARLTDLEVAYQTMPLRVINNGHTIQVNCAPGSGVTLGGRSFRLVQFHFHHPSEHLVDGRHFDMEAHFVHAADAGDLAVLGVFLVPGRTSEALAPIWQAMPREAGPEVAPAGVAVAPAGLLPADHRLYRYYGSLTTPPCSETVTWSVFRAPVEVSPQQIEAFAALFPMNARPVAPLNRRFLLESLTGG